MYYFIFIFVMSSSRAIVNYLTVGCWNIEGLYEKVNGIKLCKLDEPTFLNRLKSFDILCLQETHVPQGEIIPKIDDFHITPHCRGKSANNRYFGGMLLFIRRTIKKGVKIEKQGDQDTFQIKILKNYFGWKQDVKIVFTYASPINSGYTKSRSVNILDKIESDLEGGHSIIMGDLNGRSKVGEDFVRDSEDKHSPINIQNYIKDTYLGRFNSDTHQIDQQGRKILDLCKVSRFRILNGRTRGDMSSRNGSKYDQYLRISSRSCTF